MRRTLVIVERDDLSFRAFSLTFEVPNESFDLMSAVRDAVTDFCMTEEGRKIYEYNCRCFNWADFEANVTNEFCEKHGFSRVLDTYMADEIVDWDEQLADDSVLDDEEDD